MNYEQKQQDVLLTQTAMCATKQHAYCVYHVCTTAGVLWQQCQAYKYLCQMSWTSWCVVMLLEIRYDLLPHLIGVTVITIIIIIIIIIIVIIRTILFCPYGLIDIINKQYNNLFPRCFGSLF